MKKLLLGLAAFGAVLGAANGARAADVMVAAAMQRCTTNEECTLVTGSCADNCAFIPVNKMNLTTLQGVYQSRCGKPMESNPQCNVNPPIAAACINSRCTVDYAYANHAGAKDYQTGAYNAAETPVASPAPASAAPANDRQGFTAYKMQNQGTPVHQNTLGEIHTTIYVPPSAPVSGGNYVPVGQAPAATPYTAPATAAPVAPKATLAPYKPSAATYATPTDIVPAQQRQLPIPIATPPPAGAVPVQQPTPKPTATTTPVTNATPANPIPSSASKALPEPRVPDVQPMVEAPDPVTGVPSAPVPPSDYKEQKFVPPAGSTIPVAPEDPGAKPPAGMTLVPRGPDDAPQDFSIKTKADNSSAGANQ